MKVPGIPRRKRAEQPKGPLPEPHMELRDLFSEAAAGLMARPARVALTVLGTVIGVAALVATLGLSKTASNQIVGRFDAVAATDVVVTPVPAAQRSGGGASNVIPWDAESRMRRLNGVAEAGTLAEVNVRGALVRSVPINDPLGSSEVQLPVRAASPGLWPAVRANLVAGRFPDQGHSARGDRVAVLGINAAQRLGITSLDQQPAIFLGDRLYQVIGLVGGVERQVSLLGSMAIPNGTARQEFGVAAPSSVQIETEVGAVELIVRQAPEALNPPTRRCCASRPRPTRSSCGGTSRTTSTRSSFCSAACRSSWARWASRTSRSCRCSSAWARSGCAAPWGRRAATSQRSS
jgi:hypothetical protein